jgi:tetratricopeptide (TPR) repeat protein
MRFPAYVATLAIAWLLGVLVTQGTADVKQCTIPFSNVQPAICAARGSERAEMLFEIGIERSSKNSITEAIAAWDQAIAADPKFIEAYVAKADWLIHQRKMGPALAFLEEAYRRLPGNPEIAYLLGKLHARSSRPEAAFQYFTIALRQKPDHVLANYELGLMLEQMNRMEQAVRHYERAGKLYHVEGSPRHLIWVEAPFVAAARVYYHMNKPEKALLAISRWFAAAPPRMRDGYMYEARARNIRTLGAPCRGCRGLFCSDQGTAA